MKTHEANQAKAISRRTFLKTTAALGWATVAPTIVPSSVLGANAPSNRIAIGMIGMGRQALGANLKPFLHSQDTTVVSVCDVDGWRLERAKKAVEDHYSKQTASGTYRGCHCCGDFRDVLASEPVDAVMISTPDHWHVPMAIEAAKAGKDIALEKPITLSIAEGRALCDAVTRYGRVFRVDSECRSAREFRRLCELVLNGRIGKVHTIHVGVPFEYTGPMIGPQPNMPVPKELDYDMWLGPAPHAPYTEKRVHPPKGLGRPGWMRVTDYCDGIICNWGAHLVDIAQWANNTERTGPIEIDGKGQCPRDGLWDVMSQFDVHYRYANGVEMFYTMDRPYVRAEGNDGWIEAEWWKQMKAHPKSILESVIGPDEIHLPDRDEKTDFIQAVKNHTETAEPVEVGHRTTSVCQLGLISCQLGRKLIWDPQNECVVNDETASRLLRRPLRAPWSI